MDPTGQLPSSRQQEEAFIHSTLLWGSLDSPLSPDPPTEARVTLSFLHYSSVPEIKKVNPLLLKIHLKLSNSPSPEN